MDHGCRARSRPHQTANSSMTQGVQKPTLSVVGGALGAGKTSLIARLLKDPEMSGTGVVVNEFGALGVDDMVLSAGAPGTSVALLQNGCVCCRPGNDLSDAVKAMCDAAPNPLSRIIVETSGVADLSAVIARIAADHRLRPVVRLDAAIAVVDATAPTKTRAENLACADRIVISKGDMVGPQKIAEIRTDLTAMNIAAPVLDGIADLNPTDLFDAGLVNARTGETQPDRWLRLGAPMHVHDHTGQDQIRSWVIEAGPVEWAALSRAVAEFSQAAGPHLLRVKGLIADHSDPRPLALQVVRNQVYRPVRLTASQNSGCTQIVVIAHAAAAPSVAKFSDRVQAISMPIYQT